MNPMAFLSTPITAERAMQCIIAALHSSLPDKEKLRRIDIYADCWVFEKPEPLPGISGVV